MRLILLFSLLLVCGNKLLAQEGYSSLLFHGSPASLTWQPAQLLDSSSSWAVVAEGGYRIANNYLPIGTLNSISGYLDDTKKESILGALGENPAFHAYAPFGFRVIHRIKNHQFQLGLNRSNYLDLRFTNPDLLGLALKGNAPYAGTTVADPQIFYNQGQAWGLDLGWAARFGSFQAGVRVTGLLPGSWQRLQASNFSVFTATYGEQLDLTVDYQWQESKGYGNGWGASVDLGAVWEKGPLRIEASALRLGSIRQTTSNQSASVNISFQGVEISDPFNGTDYGPVFSQIPDSFREEIFPDTLTATQWTRLPGLVRLGIAYQLNAHNRVSIWGTGNWDGGPGTSFTPSLVAGYVFSVSKINLDLGLTAGIGGYDTYQAGLHVQKKIALGGSTLWLNAGSDQLLGWLVPDTGKGYGAWGGLGFSW